MSAALWALVVTLAAAPASPAQKPKLAVMDLVGGAELDRAAQESLTASVAAEVARRGIFDVVSSKEMTTLLGLERQKQLLGCSEDKSSCLTELAGALGADLVLSGTIAHMGAAWTMNLQTTDAKTARTLGRSVRIARDLGDFSAGLPFAVAEATGLPAPEVPSRVLPVAAMVAGGLAIAAGGLVGMQGLLKEREVASELSLADNSNGPLRPATAYANDASLVRTEKSLGVAGRVLGAALLGGGAAWYSLSGTPTSAARVAVVPGGPGLAVVGSF